MSAYTDALATVRAARAARDQARDDLHALQLRGLQLQRAVRRESRGHGAVDDAVTKSLDTIRGQTDALDARAAAIGTRLAELQQPDNRADALAADLEQADARSSELANQVGALGEQLTAPHAVAGEGEDSLTRLRDLQAERAELAHTADGLRSDLTAVRDEVLRRRAEATALAEEARAIQSEAAQAREQLAALEAQAAQPDLEGTSRDNADQLAAKREHVAELENGVQAAIAGVYDRGGPQKLIGEWDDGLPILLLPLRVETRWKSSAEGGDELRVRVYPDDLEVTTHEKLLTDAEVAAGQAYWTARQAATTDLEHATPWAALSQRFGANRAAWTARETKPLNWDQASTDPTLALDFPPVPLTKPDSWTDAPHSRVLPDRLVLLGWRGGSLVVDQVGPVVDDVVVLGPAPLEDASGGPSISRDPVDQTLALGDSFSWVRDFDEAVARGLGFRIPVDAATARDGLDELVVLGLKGSADDADAQVLLGDLIDNHHYARPGFALVQQGTPTNNTGGNDSGYSRSGRTADESAIEVGPPLFVPTQDRARATDGQRLADLLGLDYDPLLHATGANLTDNADAVAANRALYAGTLGYYLDHMLDGVVDEEVLWTLRHHFTDTVTGRGPVSAIRVGSQPYGILPTSAFARWRTPGLGSGEVGIVIGHHDPFEGGLYQVLARMDQAWSSALPGPVRIGAPGDGAAHLLDVLGLHPTSEEFYQRVGYSYDTLRNIEAFMTSSTELADVMKMIIEGMAARGFLTGLGYDSRTPSGAQKPLPLLLRLIWRHAHQLLDPSQLIDGQPLSETAGVKPYDAAAGTDFLDWLVSNAADADKLEAQDFGGAPRPSSLLYMMLHFSLAMESARGVRDWLGTHAVEADILIRSTKFLNIGASPTPSTWEVLRAPASSIVADFPSDRPLLELLHSPQLDQDSGRGVAEQRDALEWLRGASTARLERVLVEHVDTLSYRLDAWQTSLFTRRLHRQRNLDTDPKNRRTGVYLGAYGYLENLRPNPGGRRAVPADTLPPELRSGTGDLSEEIGNGGYVHAPSLNHATAAALLRNGYLTHATPADPESLAVNLSSDRVRRARYLLDGFRGGQSLEALLGAQFERGLHDWTTRPGAPVVLDQLKPLFRAAFPIKVTRVPQAANAEAGAGAATVTEDHLVVNGVDLANAQAFPWGIPELTGLSDAQKSALQHEKDGIRDTMDALRDVLTAESAYQLALGNFERAAAVVQSVGRGTPPPDIEIVNTPRGTDVSFTNRLAIQLSTAAQSDPWPAVGALTQRALLEPALNAWLGSVLPDPAHVHCRVVATAADGSVLADDKLSLADLGLQPIDVVYLARSQPQQSSEAELESRACYAFARAHAVPDEAVVRITFGDGGGAGPRTFGEVLPLLDRLRRLLGSCRPLNARHFQSASADAPQPPDNPGRLDVAELRVRVETQLGAFRSLFRNGAAVPPTPPLELVLAAARVPGAPSATVEALRAALLAIADAGFVYAFPVSAVGTGTRELDLLAAQSDSVLARFDALATETDATLLDLTGGSYPADRQAEILSDLVKGWWGGDVLLLPRFTFIDPAGVATAHADRGHLLDHAHGVGMALPVTEWLHGAACVRPTVHDFEMVRAMAEAQVTGPLPISPLQLPHRIGDSWLGVEFPTGTEVVHDTVAIVQHLPQGFDPHVAQCGLLVDEWGESIPNRNEVTGLTFNYDAPNSEPPQALLLAVTPEETGSWDWDDLVETVRDTFRRARLRAVEPDQVGGMAGIGTLLPAVIAEFSTGRGSISLDYSHMWAPIRETAAKISATQLAESGVDMAELTSLMVASPELLSLVFRDPAITAWNRLEARPRTQDFTRSLRAEVRDPLWFLTRQWQLGEFEAQDAASPIDARLLTRKATVDRVRLGGGETQAFDDSAPLESLVERERVPFTHALRVQAGQYLLDLHPQALRAKYLPRYRSAFGFATLADGDFRGDVDGRNLYQATQRLGFDGEAALAAIEGGTFAADVPVDPADAAAFTPIVAAFRGWLARQYSQPDADAPAVWDSGRLSYGFAAAAPTEGGQQLGLTATRYDEGRLDWFSFELDQDADDLVVEDAGYVPPPSVREAISFIPARATFKGVPNARFWEMEERQVNFGSLNAQTTDQLLMVFAEIGLVYGNDWYVIPYRLPVNTLCEVLGLVVTDVFGDRTVVRAADEGDGSWQRWSLFNLSNAGDLGGYNRQFLLPSALGQGLESDPLERVQLVRDETANLVWAIEEVVPAATGRGINGYDAADKTGVVPDPIANTPAAIRYVLGNAVPENWIPFIPVQRAGGVQDIAFQRAAMPQLGQPPHDVIRAKGVLLNEAALPWFVNEEDVPVTGKLLTRAYQRVRWYDGKTCLWIGRRAETGHGAGSSGLAFDQIDPINAAGGG